MFSCEFWEIFKNIFTEHFQEIASQMLLNKKQKSKMEDCKYTIDSI